MFEWKRLLTLLGACLLLGVLLFSQKKQESKSFEAERKEHALMTLQDGETIVGIRIERSNEPFIEIAKESGFWNLKAPISYRADAIIADGLAAALRNTQWDRSFKTSELSPEDAGLAKPSLTIQVKTSAEGTAWKKIEFGSEGVASRLYYAKWEDSDQILMLNDSLVRSFQKSVYAMRNKKLLPLGLADVSELRFSFEGSEMILKRKDRGWVYGEPEAKADRFKAEAYVREVLSLYIREFLDEANPENPDLGLTPTENFISVLDQKGKLWNVKLGNFNEEKAAFYAWKQGELGVFLIPAPSVGPLHEKRDMEPEAEEPDAEDSEDVEAQPKSEMIQRLEAKMDAQAEQFKKLEDVVTVKSLRQPVSTEVEDDDVIWAPSKPKTTVTTIDAISEALSSSDDSMVNPAIKKTAGTYHAIRMRKLTTEVQMMQEAGEWIFVGSDVRDAAELAKTIDELMLFLENLPAGISLGLEEKPVIPYFISVGLDGAQPEEYVFYKRENTVLIEQKGKSQLTEVDAKIWVDLDQFLRRFLMQRN